MKKIIQSIYGMQYEELEEKGRDGKKARFNGNLLVAAYIIVAIFLILLLLILIPSFNEKLNQSFHNAFGYTSGKTIGKLLTLPLLAIIYYIVTGTIGSEAAFQRHVEAYKKFSEEEKKKSVARVMIPFMSMLGIMLVLALS